MLVVLMPLELHWPEESGIVQSFGGRAKAGVEAVDQLQVILAVGWQLARTWQSHSDGCQLAAEEQ